MKSIVNLFFENHSIVSIGWTVLVFGGVRAILAPDNNLK